MIRHFGDLNDILIQQDSVDVVEETSAMGMTVEEYAEDFENEYTMDTTNNNNSNNKTNNKTELYENDTFLSEGGDVEFTAISSPETSTGKADREGVRGEPELGLHQNAL